MKLRWTVRAGDGALLRDVLARAGADRDAVTDGRVFVGRRRALSGDERVTPGDDISVAEKSGGDDRAVILLDGDGVVAADKPADVPTIPDHDGASQSLVAMVARAVGCDPAALHPTSRLDRGVSGVVLFARTEAAAERLRVAREQRLYVRRYVAIAAHVPPDADGSWDAPIGRAADPRRRTPHGRDAAPSLTHYRTAGRAGDWALLGVEPITGRTHQIRVHAADAGAPLLGDRVYGGPSRATLPSGAVLAFDRIALHAARVRVPRPDGSVVEVCAPVPEPLRRWWDRGGGDEGAWEVALTAPATSGSRPSR